MNIFNEKAKEIITNMVIATMPKIEVNSGICRFNFRCQMNAVHDAITNQENKIAMCIYFEGENPIVHFINIDNNGNYVDNTLGAWSVKYDYYLVRHIEKESFFSINNIFASYIRELKMKLPFYVRLFSDYDF